MSKFNGDYGFYIVVY